MAAPSPQRPAADVLLVDDDPSGLAILGLALRRAGLSVVSFSNPNAAIEELRRRRFRWLVTDAQMTPQDGFELARIARQSDPDLRIVMISALVSESDIEDTPIERLFSKPVPFENLVAWLKDTGGQPPAWR
ncbi:MAG: response regulator [Elusimicrobia bacterium]|nr:response regulator [Elusimicrobiota bacterium]